MSKARRIVELMVLFAACLLLASCADSVSDATNNDVGVNTTPGSAPAVQAAVADGDSPGYNPTLDGQRYSPLETITVENVASLTQVCVADLGESGNFQSGIVVVNNMLYATTDANTFAYDPATCQQKWKHQYEKRTSEGLKVNRGVAYADGKVFRGVNTGALIAIDANTG